MKNCFVGFNPRSSNGRRGKKSYHYLQAIRVARRTKMWFYMCQSGEHWHCTSNPWPHSTPGRVDGVTKPPSASFLARFEPKPRPYSDDFKRKTQ